MIRRHVGNQFYLITQHDHAIVAEQLARHIANGPLVQPDPKEPTLLGVRLHDCGWPIHDDLPTLNPQNIPLDVFDSIGMLGLRLWTASADRATGADAYAGLLVSLHVLSLSLFMVPQTQGIDPPALALKFELNKFQHREIERQETLRRRLGMRLDIPLNLGLAKFGIEAQENQLTTNFRLLQAMDLLSLGLCCTHPPVAQTGDVFRADNRTIQLHFKRDPDDSLHVDPWPFGVQTLELSIPYRAVSDQPFESETDFRAAYAAAEVRHLPLRASAR